MHPPTHSYAHKCTEHTTYIHACRSHTLMYHTYTGTTYHTSIHNHIYIFHILAYHVHIMCAMYIHTSHYHAYTDLSCINVYTIDTQHTCMPTHTHTCHTYSIYTLYIHHRHTHPCTLHTHTIFPMLTHAEYTHRGYNTDTSRHILPTHR